MISEPNCGRSPTKQPRCHVCRIRRATVIQPRTIRGTEGMCRNCRDVCRTAMERGWTIEAWIVHAKNRCVRCKVRPRGVVHANTRACDVYLCGPCRDSAKEQFRQRRAKQATPIESAGAAA